MVQTEFPFTLPHGYVDANGAVHREGIMRMATAMDEIAPLKDRRVQSNPGYLVIILLSRVVTRLGDLEQINPKVIEDLFAGDLAYLQDLYQRINHSGSNRITVTCPYCEQAFEVELGAWASDRMFVEFIVRGRNPITDPFPTRSPAFPDIDKTGHGISDKARRINE